jgi:hypothetical protein
VEVPRQVQITSGNANIAKRKGPAVSARPLFWIRNSARLGEIVELPIPVLLTLLARLLARTVRILLLLSRFLTAALLLTRLLPGVLILLAGILVLVRHCDLPF